MDHKRHIKSIDKCIQLYKKSIKSNSTLKTGITYKNYRNCLTKIKRKAKVEYYTKRYYTLKSNMKKLWQLMNNIINNNNDKTSIIDYITVNNVEYYGAKEVTKHFGKYYLEIGQKLAQTINSKEETIADYFIK